MVKTYGQNQNFDMYLDLYIKATGRTHLRCIKSYYSSYFDFTFSNHKVALQVQTLRNPMNATCKLHEDQASGTVEIRANFKNNHPK